MLWSSGTLAFTYGKEWFEPIEKVVMTDNTVVLKK